MNVQLEIATVVQLVRPAGNQPPSQCYQPRVFTAVESLKSSRSVGAECVGANIGHTRESRAIDMHDERRDEGRRTS